MDPMYRDSLCRFCLCSGENLIDLFEENSQHGFIIEEEIEDLLRLKVSRTDGYPPFICPLCLEKVDSFRLFKCQCHSSRTEYAERFFHKAGSFGAGGKMHSVTAGYRCVKQEPDEGVTEDYVPCEVSIKTEHEGDFTSSDMFKDTREISDYSEGDEEVGEMQVEPDIPTDPSYYSEQTAVDPVRSEVTPKRKSWDKTSMVRAVEAVVNKEMSLLKASKAFNVPRSTIKDYVKKNGKNSVDASIGRKPVLPAEVEGELVEHCLELEERFFGLTAGDVERSAYRLATRRGLRHPFSDERQAAGRKWTKQFFQRHPELTHRKPHAPLAARASQGFTRANVRKFFSALEPELQRINFSPERLFCVDETALAVGVQEGKTQVVGVKGRTQVESLSPAERSSLVTVVTCMSAAGQFLPPMLVLPHEGERVVSSSRACAAPPGTLLHHDDSGWLRPETFLRWLRHFSSLCRPAPLDPVVLVLDGHYPHNRSIDAFEWARSNGVLLVSLPPHSTHKMHPVELGFMAAFKMAYLREVEEGAAPPSSCCPAAAMLSSLVAKAHKRAATVEAAAEGFWKAGISPFQSNAFGDHDFASSKEGGDILDQPGTSGGKNSTAMSSPFT